MDQSGCSREQVSTETRQGNQQSRDSYVYKTFKFSCLIETRVVGLQLKYSVAVV